MKSFLFSTPALSLLSASALLSSAVHADERADTFAERLHSDADIDASFAQANNGSFLDNFTFGSYGELHYNAGENTNEELDLHRLVLFAAYEFNKKSRFITEIEVEHLVRNRDGNKVQYELEQAYFEFDLPQDYSLQVGGFLVPVGIINEIHEPTTFYGVERNRIESEIIPTTFTEFGVLLRKTYDSGLQWDFAVHRGLKLDNGAFNSSRGPDIRSGRQKAGSFDDLFSAATARVKYTGIKGLEIAGSVQYQDDISERSEKNSAILTSAHFIYNSGGFSLRGLAAQWSIDGNGANGVSFTNDKQYGAYIEPSYKWSFGNGSAIGVFGRALRYENEDRPDGQTEFHTGINYWPNENVVLKADYIKEDGAGGRGDRDLFNLGVGYSF